MCCRSSSIGTSAALQPGSSLPDIPRASEPGASGFTRTACWPKRSSYHPCRSNAASWLPWTPSPLASQKPDCCRQEIQDDAQALLHSVFQRLIQGAAYRPLAEFAPIVRRPVPIELDGAYPELWVRSFGRGTFHKPLLPGSEVGTKKLFHIRPGDLVFSNVFAWEGAIAVAKPEDAGRVGSHRFITCVARPEVATADFFCFYLLTPEGMEQVRDASPGGAGRNRTLGLTKLERIRVPVPGIDDQREFTDLQAKVAAIRQAQSANQPELDALLPAVLDKAFKGEL